MSFDQETATVNHAHGSAFVHCFVSLGFNQAIAQQIGQLLVRGLWNRQQDYLLAMLASCGRASATETSTAGFDAIVANIHRITVRAHATVFYRALLKRGLVDQDAAQLARFFARGLSNKNCDTLKALLLDGIP